MVVPPPQIAGLTKAGCFTAHTGETNSERLKVAQSTRNSNNSNRPQPLVKKLTNQDIHIEKLLGYGAFSTAHRATIKNIETGHFDSEEAYAIKKLRSGVVKGDRGVFKIAAADLALETKILANITHENIIRLVGIKDGDMIENLKDGSYFIVLELLSETLHVRLEKWRQMRKKSLFGRTQVALVKRLHDVALGIARAMEYLHSRNIMFRDLKPANIGFDHEGRVKLFDFGLAREYDEDLEGKNLHVPRYMTGGAGTPRYMAPEVARMDEDYGFPADVYSFSVLLWQIITHRTPYKKITTTKQFDLKVVKNHCRPSLSYIENAQLKNLLEAGWCPHPQERPSFSTIRRSLEMLISRKKSKSRSRRRLLVATENGSARGQRLLESAMKRVDEAAASVASTVNSEPLPLRPSLRVTRTLVGPGSAADQQQTQSQRNFETSPHFRGPPPSAWRSPSSRGLRSSMRRTKSVNRLVGSQYLSLA